MATVLTTPSVSATIKANLQSGVAPAIVTSGVFQTLSPSITVGNAAGQVSNCFSEAFTVTNGTPLVINLTTGDDPLGNALGALHLMGFLIENDSTTSGQDFSVGGGTDPALASDSDLVPANGGFTLKWFGLGIALNSSTAFNIQITVAAGTAVPGKITIFTRNA